MGWGFRKAFGTKWGADMGPDDLDRYGAERGRQPQRRSSVGGESRAERRSNIPAIRWDAAATSGRFMKGHLREENHRWLGIGQYAPQDPQDDPQGRSQSRRQSFSGGPPAFRAASATPGRFMGGGSQAERRSNRSANRWDPAATSGRFMKGHLREENFPARQVSPQRRPSILPPGHRPRGGKVARFESERDQQRAPSFAERRQPSAAPRTRFPFTVFGKGRQNRRDADTSRPNRFGLGDRGGRDGQHVGKDIMRKYVFKKALKKGGMADAISLVSEKKSGNLFIQKCIPLRDERDKRRSKAEINTLLKIDAHGRHANLNAIAESEVSERRRECNIILEYCDMGSVAEAIVDFRQSGQHPPESSAWNLMAGVANGLAFLHHGVMNGRQAEAWDAVSHLDVKTCNVFLSSSGGHHGYARIVLADFGCAVTRSDIIRHIEHPFIQECGTASWYPPEGRIGETRNPHYGVGTDIWQLGAIIHVFCKLIIPQKPDRQYLARARPCSGYYSDRLNRVVKQLCHPESRSRPNAIAAAREAADGFEQAMRGRY